MNAPSDTTFVCPACGTTLPVGASKRAALLAHGCAVCGTAVRRDAFRPSTDPRI